MTLTLYMGHHVPLAVTQGLRRRGVDVVVAHDDGASALEDDALLERATKLGRTLFSQDADLLVIARQRQEAGIPFSGVTLTSRPSRSGRLFATWSWWPWS